MKKQKLIPLKEKKEIFWNLINSLLAGLLVLFGAFTSGHVSIEGFVSALFASALVAVVKFKEYWDGEKKEFACHFGTFL